jgi:hypothetical protein
MRLSRTRLVRRVAALAVAATLLGAPAALAQTTTTSPYPGTPTTLPPLPTSAEVDLGLQETGAILNISLCNFAPGSTIRLTIRVGETNTIITPDVVANSSGCVVVRIEILSTLVALGHAPQQMLAATGLAATATKVQISVNGQVVTVGPYGTVVTMIANGTGTNGAARTATVRFTVVKRGTISRSGLVRTGTTVIKWTPFGLGLIGVGYLLVLATRRRRQLEPELTP